MTEKFAFLSPEWEIAAESLHDSKTAEAPEDITFSMNVTISPTPYGDKLISVSVDEGIAQVDKAHIDSPDLTVKTDYDTAYRLFLEGEMNIILSAMLEGKLTVGGDVAKLLSMAGNPGAMPSMPFLENLADRLKLITQ